MGSDFLITGDHLLNANKTSKGCGLRRCNSYNIVKNVFVNLLVADLISCTMLLSCIIVVQSLSNVWLFATPWTSACQASLPSLSPGVCSDSCPLSQWCYLIISSSATCFSFSLPSFSASGSFPVSRFFTSSVQSIGASASASVLPMNTQDWFPLGFTGLMSL